MKHNEKGILIVGPMNFIDFNVDSIGLVSDVGGELSDLVLNRGHIRKIIHSHLTGINLFTGNYGYWNYNTGAYTLKWEVGCLVHEAQHREDFRKRPLWALFSLKGGERSALEVQNRFYEQIGYPQLDVEKTLDTRYYLKLPFIHYW